MSPAGGNIHILLIEDNPGDARLTKEAFKEWTLKNEIHVAQDGEEALSFLYKKDSFANAPRPDLILLDLNMPKKNGQEVLNVIKNDESLRRIPVIILTTSRAFEDITNCYNHHANCYIVKPVEYDQFVATAKSIENFWFGVAELRGGGS